MASAKDGARGLSAASHSDKGRDVQTALPVRPMPRTQRPSPARDRARKTGCGLQCKGLGAALLLDGVASVAGGYHFADRASLLVARDAWCADATAAAATYGPIGEWDVSEVTDF